MRALFLLIAAALAATSASGAEPDAAVLAAEAAAPTVECNEAPDSKGFIWCWTKVQLPDKTLVGVVLRKDLRGKLEGWSRIISQKSAQK